MNGIKKNVLVVEDSEYYMNLICNALSKIPDINIYIKQLAVRKLTNMQWKNLSQFLLWM